MNTYDSYLAHHGIKGQRWGIRRTPEQLGHRPKTTRKKKSKVEKTDAEKREELKQYLRKHPKKLPKYSDVLSEADAAEIIKGIEFDRKLKDVRQQEIDRGWTKVKSFRNNAQTIADLYTTGRSIYNSYVEINNAFVDAGKMKNGRRLTKLGEKPEDLTSKMEAKAKKEREASFNAYLQSHNASDFYKNRSSFSPEEARSAVVYYTNLEKLKSGSAHGIKAAPVKKTSGVFKRKNN